MVYKNNNLEIEYKKFTKISQIKNGQILSMPCKLETTLRGTLLRLFRIPECINIVILSLHSQWEAYMDLVRNGGSSDSNDSGHQLSQNL